MLITVAAGSVPVWAEPLEPISQSLKGTSGVKEGEGAASVKDRER